MLQNKQNNANACCRKALISAIILVTAVLPFFAKAQDLSLERIRPAYEAALDFRFQESSVILDAKGIDPLAPERIYVDNLTDFLRIFATENEALYDSLQELRTFRIDQLGQSPVDGPYSLFVLAETKLHWAIMDARFGHYIRASKEALQAYHLLEENAERYPEFILNQKSLAVFHGLVGIIPSGYRWGFKLLSGMEGTVQQGLREIEQVVEWTAEGGNMFYRECIIMQVYMLMHLADQPDRAQQKILASGLDPVNGPLDCFVFSNVALKTRNANDALRYLRDYESQRNGFDLPFFYFMRGLASLQVLDIENARRDLRAFLSNTRSKHYVKEAHQKLGWAALLEGDSSGYLNEMTILKSRGAEREGGDQHAQAEAERGWIPNVPLLRVRLLFDGGQCQRAWELLEGYALEDFDASAQLEYLYRMGRVSHCLGHLLLAPVYYIQVIQLGAGEDHYFACHSALQAGRIYEDLGQYEESESYYRRCLDLQPEEYTRYLHAQAKAGLERLAQK